MNDRLARIRDAARRVLHPRTAYFHEDDYCQVEVLPAAAAGYCLSEMGRIDEFAAAHWDGFGFTDIYPRKRSPIALSTLGITRADLRAAVEPLLPPFDRVLTGYASHREERRGTIGWGEASGEALFAAMSEEDVVEAIWLSVYSVSSNDQAANWRRVLSALPCSQDLILADWSSSVVVPLSDAVRLEAYFRGDGP